ncbi:MAG: hypothetical protein Ta2B_29070 [Termitinemataceae bacterium]|nr:MAG: hypothetical protein Ta2B_29070 [Termitinemataceae bacterium]
MNNLASLAVFGGLTLNLILQLGLGINQIRYEIKSKLKYLALNYVNLFLTICILWLLWSYALSPLALGFTEYFLMFPFVCFLFSGIEMVFYMLFMRNEKSPIIFEAKSYHGLGIAALLIMLRMANNLIEALVLGFSFSLGAFIIVIILIAVRQRTVNERVPLKFRGMPLLLISFGLISLVLSSLAFILLLK